MKKTLAALVVLSSAWSVTCAYAGAEVDVNKHGVKVSPLAFDVDCKNDDETVTVKTQWREASVPISIDTRLRWMRSENLKAQKALEKKLNLLKETTGAGSELAKVEQELRSLRESLRLIGRKSLTEKNEQDTEWVQTVLPFLEVSYKGITQEYDYESSALVLPTNGERHSVRAHSFIVGSYDKTFSTAHIVITPEFDKDRSEGARVDFEKMQPAALIIRQYESSQDKVAKRREVARYSLICKMTKH